MTEAQALMSLMRNRELRCRTGILFLGLGRVGQEKAIAATLDIEVIDFVELVLETLPPEASFASLSLTKILQCLNRAADAGGRDCAILANFDLPLAKLQFDEIAKFWRWFFQDMPHKRKALVACLVGTDTPHSLFPDDEIRSQWTAAGRLATFS